jgi:hypothetical protein
MFHPQGKRAGQGKLPPWKNAIMGEVHGERFVFPFSSFSKVSNLEKFSNNSAESWLKIYTKNVASEKNFKDGIDLESFFQREKISLRKSSLFILQGLY